ncbi:AAA family ATPase [Prosthecobacter dejongeii]|nr:AAA family ATPase [Prosthecobacter dejongeii]
MPITRISVQNFKGIGQRTEITLKPITLFFGANSAGKSTLLQALLYLREVLERGNADADVVEGGGSAIDLGGFRQIVHQHNLANTLSVGVTVALDDDGLPMPKKADGRNAATEELHRSISEIKEIGVEVGVEWSLDTHKPVVARYNVVADGTPILRISQQRLDRPRLWLNEAHPSVRRVIGAEDEDPFFESDGKNSVPTMVLEQTTVIPSWHEPLVGSLPGGDTELEPPELPMIEEIVERLALGAGKVVLQLLNQIRYIGPLREYPPRRSTAQRTPSNDRWATGLAAWDWLGTETNDPVHKRQVNAIGEWMTDTCHLDLGYTVRHQSWLEIDAESDLYRELSMAQYGDEEGIAERLRLLVLPRLLQLPLMHRVLMNDMRNGAEVDPQDIGNGVTQVIPVLAGLKAEGGNILAVEQPELHLHPAVQCRLADIFIRSLHDGRERLMLLETHSEHLMLRLMKRMRETSSDSLNAPELALSKEDVQVIYVESFEGRTVLREMPLNSRGEWVKSWPGGFFDEDINEIF